MSDPVDGQSDGVRLDVWLWAARWFKTRTLCKRAIDGGKVDVNGGSGKPARLVRVGDMLRITRADQRHLVEITALSERRGPASEAAGLYAETPESIKAREQQQEIRRLGGAQIAMPSSKPDKRDQRRLREFKHGQH